MVYSCTPSNQQRPRSVSGRKVHATTYMPEVGTVASTSSTHSSTTSAKTPMKPVKTEGIRSSNSTCETRTSLSPSQTSMTSSNSSSSLSSSGSSKQDSMLLSPESASTTSRSHHRTEKFTGISPESQSSLRRHILSHANSNAMKLKDEPGVNKEPSRTKDDQAINLSTSPRAPEHSSKSSDKHSVELKGDRLEDRRAGLTSGGRALSMGPGQAPLALPYRDIIHQPQFREHSSAVPLNLVNTAPSPSLINASTCVGSGTDNKEVKESAATPSRSSSRDSTASVSRPSAPVNPAADMAPGMLPPWAGLPYGSMGYMLPWDTMFREQLRSLPEEERRRLIEMGYIPPHLLLDAGLADPRYPGGASWSQTANPAPVPLIVKDNSKAKIKAETSGHDRTLVRDRSPLRNDNTETRTEASGRPTGSPRVDIKVDEGQGPGSCHSQVYTVTAPTIASGGQVIKVDVTAEHKTQVDIKPFNVVPQPAASNNGNRQSQADEPASGKNKVFCIPIHSSPTNLVSYISHTPHCMTSHSSILFISILCRRILFGRA